MIPDAPIAVPQTPDLHGLPPEAAGDFVGFIKSQLTEMLTAYGPIDLLWIDQFSNKYTGARWPEFQQLVKRLQPRCLVLANNARTLEQSDILGYEYPWKAELPALDNDVPAEVCDTLQDGARWFWRQSANGEDLQTAEAAVAKLEACNERGANYLLDVPPDPTGLISGPQLARLQEIAVLAGSVPQP